MREKPVMWLPQPCPKEYVHGGAVFGFWRDGSGGLAGHSKADLTGWFVGSDNAVGPRWMGPLWAGNDGGRSEAHSWYQQHGFYGHAGGQCCRCLRVLFGLPSSSGPTLLQRPFAGQASAQRCPFSHVNGKGCGRMSTVSETPQSIGESGPPV
jgi:hypothetical protein